MIFLKQSFVDFEHVYCLLGYFQRQQLEKLLKITLFTHSGILKEVNDEVPS